MSPATFKERFFKDIELPLTVMKEMDVSVKVTLIDTDCGMRLEMVEEVEAVVGGGSGVADFSPEISGFPFDDEAASTGFKKGIQ